MHISSLVENPHLNNMNRFKFYCFKFSKKKTLNCMAYKSGMFAVFGIIEAL